MSTKILARSLNVHRSKPILHTFTTQKRCNSSLKALRAAFSNPSSPFYLAPGTQGPASPDDTADNTHTESSQPSNPEVFTDSAAFAQLIEQGREKLVQAGYHRPLIWEQKIVWGDHDSFQHVNNVHYVRFFESSRVHWMVHLGHRLGGPAKSEALLKGNGISLIIKALTVNYRRPVTYPDTLLISHKPLPAHPAPTNTPPNPPDPSSLLLTSSAFSVSQQAFVAHCHETLVWYDYPNLRKCVPPKEYIDAVWHRFRD